MAECVEKEALLEVVNNLRLGRHLNKDAALNLMERAINNLPAADVVAVVRCKDCRNSMLWRKPTDTVIGECLIRKMNSEDEEFCQVGADDFCSYGERRGDNG